jgi:hypothetical protein
LTSVFLSCIVIEIIITRNLKKKRKGINIKNLTKYEVTTENTIFTIEAETLQDAQMIATNEAFDRGIDVDDITIEEI